MTTPTKMDEYIHSLKTEDNLAQLITYLLLAMKTIQIRLEWTPAIHNIHGGDKAKILQSANKTRVAIEQILNILASDEDRRLVRDSISEVTHIGDIMMLQELVFQCPVGLFEDLITTLEQFYKKHALPKVK